MRTIIKRSRSTSEKADAPFCATNENQSTHEREGRWGPLAGCPTVWSIQQDKDENDKAPHTFRPSPPKFFSSVTRQVVGGGPLLLLGKSIEVLTALLAIAIAAAGALASSSVSLESIFPGSRRSEVFEFWPSCRFTRFGTPSQVPIVCANHDDDDDQGGPFVVTMCE